MNSIEAEIISTQDKIKELEKQLNQVSQQERLLIRGELIEKERQLTELRKKENLLLEQNASSVGK